MRLSNESRKIDIIINNGIASLNLALGNVFIINMKENISNIIFNNWPKHNNISEKIRIYFIQDSIGNKTIYWPDNIIWQSMPQTLNAIPNSVDIVEFESWDIGKTIYTNIIKSSIIENLINNVISGTNFIQNSISNVWLINHNLGYKPILQIFSSGGIEIDGEILHLNQNTVQIKFNNPLNGEVRVI